MEQPPVLDPDGEPTSPWLVYYDAHHFFLIWASDALAAREHVESFGHRVVRVLSVRLESSSTQ
jgi:hypothetical protein